MRFDGEYQELRNRLAQLDQAGIWKEVNPNQHQFRSNSGGILNWYPTTGNMTFQGKQLASEELSRVVGDLLTSASQSQSEQQLEDDARAIQSLSIETESEPSYLDDSYSDSELVIALVGSIGTNLKAVAEILEERLKAFSYTTEHIKISSDVIAMLGNPPKPGPNEYDRIHGFMEEGNRLRKEYKDNSILALGAAATINQKRNAAPRRRAYIINSLKNPDEVQRLRKIYAGGFFLLGVHADHERRRNYLVKDLRLNDDDASRLIDKDANEREGHGQHTRDTYHLSDFFIDFGANHDLLKMQIWRVLDLLFGKPYVTPTFDEYAMFMAFSASLRSADLSRQVGAVLTREQCIISTGANDVPKAGGGLYWPELNDAHEIVDQPDGRDYMRGEDSNAVQKRIIVDEIINSIPPQLRDEMAPYIRNSRIKDITEYGRVVHAEMEALLSASRSSISASNASLYCTTFPCHNCAKHIIAAGVARVIYVEPYPKSKAQQFHSDAITLGQTGNGVLFQPFIGVGPRKFFDLFSTNQGSGYPIIRKTDEGQNVAWSESTAKLRIQMLPCSYIERESLAAALLSTYLKGDSDGRN